MAAVISVAFAVGFAVVLYAFTMFDRLVRSEYESDREAWERDGRPRGFFWRAPECTWFKSSWAMNRLSFVWLFATPRWVVRSAQCQTWLRHLRVSVLAWNVIVVLILLVAVLK